MTFTEEDAENDGKIKREAGKEMAKQAKTQHPELWEFFTQVADNKGREPSNLLGEMAVRALEDDTFAERISTAEVDMSAIKANDINEQDLNYVMNLMEAFDLTDDGESKDFIDRIVEERIQKVSRSPIPDIRGNRQGVQQTQGNTAQQSQMEQEMAKTVENLQDRLDQVEGDNSQSQQQQTQQTQTNSSETEEIGDLFSDDEDTESGQVESEEVQPDEGPVDDFVAEPQDSEPEVVEPEPDEQGHPMQAEPTEEEIEEAMEGFTEEPEPEPEPEPEEIDAEIEIPEQGTEETNNIITSEDGDEE